ncbi:MAG: COX15/CtaA family protein [Candidatus Binatia bacterium]
MAATLPLLFIGGLVTTKGVGLIVPDWPTTFGENMFFFPWSRMIGGVFYEHSHRLLGAAVGFLTVILALWLWFWEKRRWVRGLGIAALFLVIVQGVVGGFRVVLVENTLAIFHACLAQAFFALMAALALVTSRAWDQQPLLIRSREMGKIPRLGLLTSALIYVQIVFGAVLRHTGTQLEMHLILAALVIVHAVLLLKRIGSLKGAERQLSRGGLFVGIVLLLQLGLGLGTYLGKFYPGMITYPVLEFLATAHVVGGALLLVSALSVTLWSFRLLAPAEKPRGTTVVAEHARA